jgi:hypothetical protein
MPRHFMLRACCLSFALLLAANAFAAEPPETAYAVTRAGFIRNWLKLGPIRYGKEKGDPMQGHPINYEKLAKAGQTDPTAHAWIEDEWTLTPSAGETVTVVQGQAAGGETVELTWQPLHSDIDQLDLDRGEDYELNYLVTYLWSPRDMDDAAIYVGSDDFVQITVNGRCAYVYKTERRGWKDVDEVTDVKLRAGWNVINVKCVDVSHGYGMWLCVVDDGGTPMAGTPITLQKPDSLELVDEDIAAKTKAACHEAGQEKIPPAKAFFDPVEATGWNVPIEIEFRHTGRDAPADERYPIGYAAVGDAPVIISTRITAGEGESFGEVDVITRLLRRDKRSAAEGAALSDDLELDYQRLRGVNLDEAALAGRAFKIPTDEIGFYGLEVQILKNDEILKATDYPFAIISTPDYEPQTFTDPVSGADPAAWQPGDAQRFEGVQANVVNPRKLKFWPRLDFLTSELVSPLPPNFMEIRAKNGGLGRVTPTPGRAPASETLVRSGWVERTRRYGFAVEGKDYFMRFASPACTPAVLVESDYHEMTLFEDLDALGLGQPTWVAWHDGEKVAMTAIADLDGKAPTMGQNWLLMWFQGARGWEALDVPVLVVLQHKPRELRQSKSGTTLTFDGPVDSLAVMPLWGSRIVGPDELGAGPGDDEARLKFWTQIVEDCTFWSRALRHFPLRGSDSFRMDGGDVHGRIAYEYHKTQDDWGTQPLTFAPLPYWIGLAAEHPTSVIELPGEARRTRTLAIYGPVCGTIGEAGEAHYVLKDMRKYVDEVRVAKDVQTDGAFARIYSDLVETCTGPRFWTLSSMSKMGKSPGNGGFYMHRVLLGKDGSYKFGQHCFENENSMIANLAHATAYLPMPQRQQLKAFMMRFMEIGTLLERYEAFSEGRLMYEDTQWFMSRFMIGMWSYCHYTGHWQLLRDRWPLVQAEYASLVDEMSWANLRGAGSEESSQMYQAMIAYARMAKVNEQGGEYLYGMYAATRMLALQQAMWMTFPPEGHQSQSWYEWTSEPVEMGDPQAGPRRPAKFYWWMMSRPIYEEGIMDNYNQWHATVISPFTYPYLPSLMRFLTERNQPYIDYYLAMWEKHFPDWYKGLEVYYNRPADAADDWRPSKKVGWGVYFNAPEFFASRGWMVDYTGEPAEAMVEKYLQNIWWGSGGPRAGGYEYNNRGWVSLPKALTAILEATGTRRWVEFY